MNFKKTLCIPLLSVLGISSYADYIVQYPNIPVSFKDRGQWIQHDPVETAWINVGSPHDCTSASPLENTQPLGLTYVKTFSGCQQSQERTITTSEKNTLTGAIRNSVSTKETQVLNDATYTVNSIGTKIVKECGYSAVGGNSYRWFDIAKSYDPSYTTTYGYSIEWAGVTKTNTINTTTMYPKTPTFVSGGYTYSRGAYKEKFQYSPANQLDYYAYEVCREPIAP